MRLLAALVIGLMSAMSVKAQRTMYDLFPKDSSTTTGNATQPPTQRYSGRNHKIVNGRHLLLF